MDELLEAIDYLVATADQVFDESTMETKTAVAEDALLKVSRLSIRIRDAMGGRRAMSASI